MYTPSTDHQTFFSSRIHFSDGRSIAPIDIQRAQRRNIPWLRDIELEPRERFQLLECVIRRFAIDFSEDQIFSGDAEFFADACWGGLAECPVEWWNVTNDAGDVLYQIWLYNADSGVLVEAGTTNAVGEINEGVFYGDERLGRELAVAQTEMRQESPESELASVIFERNVA